MPQPGAPIRVVELDLDGPLTALTGLDEYRSVRAYVQSDGVLVGHVDLPIHDGTCSAATVRNALAGLRPIAAHATSAPPLATRPTDDSWPTLTIAVCTRDRPADLARCLEALLAIEYPKLQILVVDNAPTSTETAELCARHATVRHVVEPRPGLDWARNRAVLEASSQIIAFTDDDARVSPNWAHEIVRPFLADEGVMAVAGLIIPQEMETPAQVVFEDYGGLSGGYKAMKMQGGADWGARGFWHYALMAHHGSGANMAFRRAVFDRVGLFDPALDVGTPTNGGGDTEMLFRVLAEGFGFAYEPRAVVRHCHRREEAALRRQIAGWGSGTYAWLTRSAIAYPRASWVILLVGARGLLEQLWKLVRPSDVPRRLVLAQLLGSLAGPLHYLHARFRARRVRRQWGPQKGQDPHAE